VDHTILPASDKQTTSEGKNLVGEVFDGSIATTDTPDVVKMSHTVIH